METIALLLYPALDAPALGAVGTITVEDANDPAWLARFHAGERAILAAIYRDHFESVHATARRLLSDADAETVAHEVFLKLVEHGDFRARFVGGALRAWLCTVTRNRAIDLLRKRKREELSTDEDIERAAGVAKDDRFAEAASARALVERFRREVLPEKWRGVFEARFMRQLTQREAATELGITRTTLAYQELRVRGLLERFLLNTQEQHS